MSNTDFMIYATWFFACGFIAHWLVAHGRKPKRDARGRFVKK